jgi:hypothetical protein
MCKTLESQKIWYLIEEQIIPSEAFKHFSLSVYNSHSFLSKNVIDAYFQCALELDLAPIYTKILHLSQVQNKTLEPSSLPPEIQQKENGILVFVNRYDQSIFDNLVSIINKEWKRIFIRNNEIKSSLWYLENTSAPNIALKRISVFAYQRKISVSNKLLHAYIECAKEVNLEDDYINLLKNATILTPHNHWYIKDEAFSNCRLYSDVVVLHLLESFDKELIYPCWNSKAKTYDEYDFQDIEEYIELSLRCVIDKNIPVSQKLFDEIEIFYKKYRPTLYNRGIIERLRELVRSKEKGTS